MNLRHRFVYAIVVSFAFSASGSVAEQSTSSEPLSIEQTVSTYGPLPATSRMTLSPSGNLIAFRKTQGEKDLVMVYSLKEKKIVSGVNVVDIQPGGLWFMSDQHLTMTVSDRRRMLGYRGSMDMSTAYVLNVESGEVDQLLRPGDGIYKGQSGLGRIVGVSADQEYVYMPAYVGESRGDRSPDYSLMRVDVDSPRNPRQVVKGDRDTIDYFLDEDGEVVAREDYSNRYNRHRILVPETDGRGWKTVFEDETEIRRYNFAGLTADRQFLVASRENRETGRVSYYTVSLTDGVVSDQFVGRNDADVGRLLTDHNRAIAGVAYQGFKPSYEIFDEGAQKNIERVQQHFADQYVGLVSWSDNRQTLVVRVEGGNTAGSYYLAPEGEPIMFLADHRPTVPESQVHPTVTYEYKARDGLTIPTILTLPRSRAQSAKKMPGIILPHGGPAAYDSLSFDWLSQALAARGYLVIQPQFRGSTGFGADHYYAGHGEWGRKMQDDLTDAVRFFSKGDLLDPERVCIVGGSYGGYAALAGAAFTPDVYRCAVSINGVTDLESLLDDRRSSGGDDHWVVSYFERSIMNGEYTDEDLKKLSPVNSADAIKIPVLLLHGENDEVVPIEQSEDMEDALDDLDKPVEYVEIDDEGHYLLEGSSRILVLKHTLEFLNANL